MVQPILLLGAGFSLASAAAYAYAGLRLRRRPVVGRARTSWTLFLTWWFAIAATALVSGALQLVAALGGRDLGLYIVGQLVSFLLVCLAYFGLVYYLLTLFTGRWGAWKPLLAFYIGFYLILLYDLSAGDPQAVDVGRWRTGLDYASTLPPYVAAVIYSLLILPPLFGSLAYAALYPRASERTTRYRIVLVAGSIFLWSIVSVVIAMPTWQDDDAVQFTVRALGLLLPFVLVAAYYPPRWVQRRLRVLPASRVSGT